MRIALIAPPFISVPPQRYGGTELFVAQLATGLKDLGHEPIVYTNGESTIAVECRWIYPHCEWPIDGEIHAHLKDINHTSWAIADARRDCDLIHLNNAPGLAHSRTVDLPMVYTIHHPVEPMLSEYYGWYPDVYYVTISDFQLRKEKLPRMRRIHHGLNFEQYRLGTRRDEEEYVAFIGRIAPMKAPHLAIQAAKRAGVKLKMAGEVQPVYQDYFDREIKPHIDGSNIEYIGEADLEAKNELLGNAIAMLFPIQWDEPFGLVTIEAMACGTPVLAFAGGSVSEIVEDGVSGWICSSVEDMADRIRTAAEFDPADVRAYAERNFSLGRMVREYAKLYEEILAERSTRPSLAVA
ncbi:MAG: glycosyltransferase family 4 protein [Terriglobales bacterium]